MPASLYRRRPIEIEALQFTGENWAEMREFTGTRRARYNHEVILPIFNPIGTFVTTHPDGDVAELWVAANHANVPLSIGEWVLHDDEGFYPCSDRAFRLTYEKVEDVDDRRQ